MEKSLDERIVASRLLLQNRYAYLDDVGVLSASPIRKKNIVSVDEKITASRLLLLNPFAYLDDEGGFSAMQTSSTVLGGTPQTISPEMAGAYSSLAQNRLRKRRSSNETEQKAIRLQRQMWRDRAKIWPYPPSNPIDILDPAVALELIGYDYALVETLGQYYHDGKQVEVAGVIDNSANSVHISRKFLPNIRNFTAAHELGHALLHEASGLHRDRPIDGSTVSRDGIEYEADKFASYFLMPSKHIKMRFQQAFVTNNFFLDDDTSFALTRGTAINLAKDCKCRRHLSRLLASAESYNGVRFVSLANQFRVSIETMAIRLEELELVNN